MLILVTSAFAADLSFTPWSGAAVEVGTDGGLANVALASPLDGKLEGGLDVRATLPWNATGLGFGDYSLQMAINFTNEDRASAAMAFDILSKEGLSRCLVELAVRADATNEKRRAPTDFGDVAREFDRQVTEEQTDTQEVKDGKAASLKRIGALFVTVDPGHRCGDLDIEAQRKLLDGYAAARTTANDLVTSASTPFDEMATGELTRSVWTISGSAQTGFTTAEGVQTERPTIKSGFTGALYHPQGIALMGSFTPKVDTQTGDFSMVSEAQFAYVSPAFKTPGGLSRSPLKSRVNTGKAMLNDESRLPKIRASSEGSLVDGVVEPFAAEAKAAASKAAEVSAVDPAAEDAPPAEPTAPAAKPENPSQLYFTVQAGWLGEYGADGFAHTGRLLAGIRPTGGGAGLLAGFTYTSDATNPFALVPTVTLSGELPDLGSKL